MPILISIRKVHVDNIFSGMKRIEFRKFFPKEYRGTLVVYECGPDSCHKVVGKFRTENVTLYDPSKGLTMEVSKCIRSTDYTDFDLDCIMRLTEPRYLVPIINTVHTAVVTLDEFNAKYITSPVLTPPRSWTRFTCLARR